MGSVLVEYRRWRSAMSIPSLSLWVLVLLGIVSGFAPTAAAVAQDQSSQQRLRQFQAASNEFDVPLQVLLATSYNQTRWENHKGKPSVAGGYGLMHLVDEQIRHDGRMGVQADVTVSAAKPTLQQAADLLGVSRGSLKTNDTLNIRGGAALLAQYAKQTHDGTLPQALNDWHQALMMISGIEGNQEASAFADNVYRTISKGATLLTTDGQRLSLAKNERATDAVQAQDAEMFSAKAQSPSPECPTDLDCRYDAARFAQNSSDPADYGNYDTANRPKDTKIKYIVIHDMEGSYESSIAWFKDPRSYVAAHYMIRSSDGQVTQMVQNKDVGWHSGNWYMNMHSIGVEHEGFAASGGSWYTEAMYQSSAKLVRYLAKKYGIPLDRQHIVGHDQYAATSQSKNAAMHTDPGPYWNWDYYMELLNNPVRPTAPRFGPTVTITPHFDTNKQTVTDCDTGGTCTTLPAQGSNFLYLRANPQNDAPLLSDYALHPDGKPGTTDIDDTSAKAVYGQQFAVAERKGEWTAIWFGGRKGWFREPSRSNPNYTVTTPTQARTITPKAGKTTIPVYGRPVPEVSAFKNGVTPIAPVALQYVIRAGQKYVAYDTGAKNDYLQVLTFDRSAAGDGEIIVGNDRYLPISYGHRQAYVKASDVMYTP